MLNTNRIQAFLRNFGYEPNVNYRPITANRCKLIIRTAKMWHDNGFAAFLMGFFVGIEQAQDGTYTMYQFEYPEENDMMEYLRQEWVA